MASKKTAQTTTMPKFKSEAEEAAWWDAHPDFIVEQFEKADLEAAQRLADRKGLPYQTYMKMLLHQALEKERVAG
jgi:hypothetical protein